MNSQCSLEAGGRVRKNKRLVFWRTCFEVVLAFFPLWGLVAIQFLLSLISPDVEFSLAAFSGPLDVMFIVCAFVFAISSLVLEDSFVHYMGSKLFGGHGGKIRNKRDPFKIL